MITSVVLTTYVSLNKLQIVMVDLISEGTKMKHILRFFWRSLKN